MSQQNAIAWAIAGLGAGAACGGAALATIAWGVIVEWQDGVTVPREMYSQAVGFTLLAVAGILAPLPLTRGSSSVVGAGPQTLHGIGVALAIVLALLTA